MSNPTSFKFACPECGGRMEANTDYAGRTVSCPHCGRPLTVPKPDARSSAPIKVSIPAPPGRKLNNRLLVVTGMASLILVGVAFWSAQTARKSRPEPGGPPPAAQTNEHGAAVPEKPKAPKLVTDLKAGPISLNPQAKSSLVYVEGKVVNDSDYQRFGVRIEIELFNKAQHKVGTASDYAQVIEPRQTWSFRALATDPRAASARIVRLSEEP
jgi:hypothetical protein